MRHYFFTTILALAAFALFSKTASALDVLHHQNGQTLQCRIDAVTDNIVTYTMRVRLPNGQLGTTQKTIAADQIKFIDFGPIPGEEELLAKLDTATVEEIDPIWDKLYGKLDKPKSNTGKIGIGLGYALLRKDADFHWKRALDLFDQINEEAWDIEAKNAAKQGRLKTLIRLGELDQAIVEARKLAAETEDPSMLIEARYIVARADFQKLKDLEEENPKWDEDDTIRPERNQLYHDTVDKFLWPYLFHGTREESAARGLLAAGEVYQFSKKSKLAEACFNDIVKLYPETEAAVSAQKALQNFNTTIDESNEAEQ